MHHSPSPHLEKIVSGKITTHSFIRYSQDKWTFRGIGFWQNRWIFNLSDQIRNRRSHDQGFGFCIYLLEEILGMGQTQERLHWWIGRYFGFSSYWGYLRGWKEKRSLWVIFASCLQHWYGGLLDNLQNRDRLFRRSPSESLWVFPGQNSSIDAKTIQNIRIKRKSWCLVQSLCGLVGERRRFSGNYHNIQLSPVYTCGIGDADQNRGIGLRFPRLMKVR